MTTKKVDPRVVKTRSNLRRALVYLMQNEKLEDISVQKITETAHITRGTFYLHYKDKNDFIRMAMSEVIDELFDHVMVDAVTDYGEPTQRFSLSKCFSYIEDNADMFTILLDDSKESGFSQQLYDRLTDKMVAYAKQVTPDPEEAGVPIRIQVSFLTSALLGLISHWLSKGLVYTSRYMTTSVNKMLKGFREGDLAVATFFDGEVTQGLQL